VHGLRSALSIGAALGLGGCTTTAPPSHPRPPLPLPSAVAACYALDARVDETTLVPVGGTDELGFWRGRLASGDERVDFHFVTPAAPAAEPRSFVLCLPILAGGEDLMWLVATDLASRGHAVAWTRRIESALRSGQRSDDLERLFRRTVVQNRALLAWARAQPELDATRTALLGLSTGGLVGAALLAVEPRLAAGALCLAGGDLPDLLTVSAEDRVVRWREDRVRDEGLPLTELQRELDRELTSDPALLAAFIATERVLMVGARWDEVIPWRNQQLLWESLGRPQRLLLPLGHYSAALALGPVLTAVDRFYRRRFAVAR
jgi:hypothetical protein